MSSWTIRQLKKLPTPLNVIAGAALVLFVLGAIVVLFNQVRACGYDKARREYEAKDKVKADEGEKLKARAEASERRVAELEPKLAVIETLGEQKKKLDESITEKIETVTKEAQHEADVTNAPTDCVTRAQRLCAKFHALKPPIDIDCAALVAKCGK